MFVFLTFTAKRLFSLAYVSFKNVLCGDKKLCHRESMCVVNATHVKQCEKKWVCSKQ